MQPAAILFDLDGTLVDSERLAQQAGIRAFRALGVPADMAFMLRLVGRDFKSGQQIVRETFGEVDWDALDRLWSEEAKTHLAQLTPMPGAVTALAGLRAMGVPVAIVTSSRRQGAEDKLRVTGLDTYVETVVSRDDVTQAKPNPEPYLTAAARLGVDPTQCLAVEDTPTGVAAGLAAGCQVIHVPDLLPATDSPAQIVADTVLDGLAQAGLRIQG